LRRADLSSSVVLLSVCVCVCVGERDQVQQYLATPAVLNLRSTDHGPLGGPWIDLWGSVNFDGEKITNYKLQYFENCF
jgi:hypothetical protein